MQLRTCRLSSEVSAHILDHNHFIITHLDLAHIIDADGIQKITAGRRQPIFDGCNTAVDYLLMMRENVCYYATIIDTYAPCIVGYSKWNNDVNMNRYCATTDWKLWGDKVLSISDEAFIVVCLICYARRWHTEYLIKPEKQVRKCCVGEHPINDYPYSDIASTMKEKEPLDRAR